MSTKKRSKRAAKKRRAHAVAETNGQRRRTGSHESGPTASEPRAHLRSKRVQGRTQTGTATTAEPHDQPRPWWAKWPGAIGLAALSLLLVIVPVAVFLFYATLPSTVGEGTDQGVIEVGPPVVLRVIALLWAGIMLCLPVLTLRWCRKMWGGWMLVGILGSIVGFISGLFPLDII